MARAARRRPVPATLREGGGLRLTRSSAPVTTLSLHAATAAQRINASQCHDVRGGRPARPIARAIDRHSHPPWCWSPAAATGGARSSAAFSDARDRSAFFGELPWELPCRRNSIRGNYTSGFWGDRINSWKIFIWPKFRRFAPIGLPENPIHGELPTIRSSGCLPLVRHHPRRSINKRSTQVSPVGRDEAARAARMLACYLPR